MNRLRKISSYSPRGTSAWSVRAAPADSSSPDHEGQRASPPAANAIAATHRHPDRNLIIVDLGTATTIDVVRAGREFVGGIILPGLRIQMEALEKNTARLPNVEIVPAAELVGRSTVECIQSGLYFGNRAAVEGLTRQIRERVFPGQAALVLATGGFSRLFEGDRLFDVIDPDLVLVGLERALALNTGSGPSRPS